MKQLYNLVVIYLTGIVIISCSSEPKKVSAHDLFENPQGLTYKLGEKSDTVFFTGVSIDSNNIEDGNKYILEEQYSKGKLNGEQIKYYLDGKVCFLRNWKNGMLEGKSKGLYPNGVTKYEGSFRNGEKDGKWTWYMVNGNVDSETLYKEGSFEMTCECCNKKYWSKTGWVPKPSFLTSSWDSYYPKQADKGPYCSKKCALDCK